VAGRAISVEGAGIGSSMNRSRARAKKGL
jgi:hypothetical protein